MNNIYNFNPYHDEYGRFCSEIVANMPKLADYKNPTKDYELSPIPQGFLDKLGKIQKPLVLKKNIIEKNKNNHPEIDIKEYNKILLNGIYKADVMFKTDPNSEYFNFVHYNEGHNPQVLIELSETKNNYEIVNFHWLRDKSLKEKLKRAVKRVDNEGGQVLIDIKETSKVGGLSNLEIDSIYIINDISDNFNPNIYESLYIPTWDRERMAEKYFKR